MSSYTFLSSLLSAFHIGDMSVPAPPVVRSIRNQDRSEQKIIGMVTPPFVCSRGRTLYGCRLSGDGTQIRRFVIYVRVVCLDLQPHFICEKDPRAAVLFRLVDVDDLLLVIVVLALRPSRNCPQELWEASEHAEMHTCISGVSCASRNATQCAPSSAGK
jgi:hypothetical protein